MNETNKFFNNKFNIILKEQYNDNFQDIINGLISKIVSLRVNLLKTTPSEIYNAFATKGITLTKVNWSDNVFYCNNEYYADIKNSEEYSKGEIYRMMRL